MARLNGNVRRLDFEELKRMFDFIQANPFVVGALTGSLAAYLLGLLVSYWRREKRWLGYSVTGGVAQGVAF